MVRAGVTRTAPVTPTARVATGVDPALPVDRAPPAFTRMAAPSKATSTVPSVSVRYVRPASSCSRSMVDGAGWPYGLPAPAETTATRGWTASRNGLVLAVREP
jgi:hypothetical protein